MQPTEFACQLNRHSGDLRWECLRRLHLFLKDVATLSVAREGRGGEQLYPIVVDSTRDHCSLEGVNVRVVKHFHFQGPKPWMTDWRRGPLPASYSPPLCTVETPGRA